MTGTNTKRVPWQVVLKRSALYFLGLDILAFFYYASGNYQGFLAETQLLLLRIMSVLSTAALLSGLGGLVLAILPGTRRGSRLSILALAGWIAYLAAALGLAVLAYAVQAFASGV